MSPAGNLHVIDANDRNGRRCHIQNRYHHLVPQRRITQGFESCQGKLSDNAYIDARMLVL